jgi:osmotically inducible protein OsmC
MNPLIGRASANWNGNVSRGNGTVSTGSGAIKTVAFGSVEHRNGSHTCPDELMAAAQAGCFCLALASELKDAGFQPTSIDTSATFQLEELIAGWTITEIFLDTTAVVARITQAEFIDVALRAKSRCAISRLYDARIWMQARLKPSDAFHAGPETHDGHGDGQKGNRVASRRKASAKS